MDQNSNRLIKSAVPKCSILDNAIAHACRTQVCWPGIKNWVQLLQGPRGLLQWMRELDTCRLPTAARQAAVECVEGTDMALLEAGLGGKFAPTMYRWLQRVL